MKYAISILVLVGLASLLFLDNSSQLVSAETTPAPPAKDLDTSTSQSDNSPAPVRTTKAPAHSAENEEQAEPASEPASSPIDRIRAIQDKTALHQSILNDHNEFTRYPSYNRRFQTAEKDPTKQRYEIDERTSLSEDKQFALTAWSDQKFYLKGDEAKLYATLQNQDGTKVQTQFAAQLIYAERTNLATYDLEDQDGDGVFELSIPLVDDDETQYLAGAYKLLIVNQDNELTESVIFMLSEPQAVLTGNYRDRITADGNLLIEAEIMVDQANRYYLEGSLYSSTRDAIGQSNNALNLNKGTHWLPLEFYGLMFHDAGEPGPFVLKHVSFARVDMPMQRAPLIEPDYHTEGYTLDSFSQQRFTN